MNKQTYGFYEKEIDCGTGVQTIITQNGIIISQRIDPKQDGAYYTGKGNPEWIGQPVKIIRGKGFKKVRFSKKQYDDFLLNYEL